MEQTKRTKNIAMALFFIGAISAICAAAKMPASGETYPDTLGVFLIAVIIAVVGNVLWHKSGRKIILAELEANKDNEAENPIFLLKATIPALEELQEQSKSGMDYCDELDKTLLKFVHPFAEKRNVLVDIMGQARGAEILLIVAYAERMLNRSWSAASDGHDGERVNSLSDSLVSYRKALKLVDSQKLF